MHDGLALSAAVYEQGHVPESYTFKIALPVKSIYTPSSALVAIPYFILGFLFTLRGYSLLHHYCLSMLICSE